MKNSRKSKIVHGVGINDADYPVSIESIIDGLHKKTWRCPAYLVWAGMIERCYSARCHERRPTYAGCSAVSEWHKFSVFREWMLMQDWKGKQIDKDILFPGNRIYSPAACVFVPRELNSFMTDNGAARGDFPIGVRWQNHAGKYQSRCRNPFTKKQEHLGLFTCQDAAHEAWRAKKHEHACRYADQQTDPRIAAALLVRYG